MSQRQYYVDPQSGDDSGYGGAASPWKTGQKAFDVINASGLSPRGSQINVKAGVTGLTSGLDFLSITPTLTAPLIIRGYTSVANDRGQGSFSGSGEYSVINESTVDNVVLIDMRFHNCGTATYIVRGDDVWFVENCEFDDGTGTSALQLGSRARVYNSYFHNFAGNGIYLDTTGSEVAYCYFKNETNDFGSCIYTNVANQSVHHNIFDVDGTTSCFNAAFDDQVMYNNTCYSNGGTGHGFTGGAGDVGHIIYNNIFEGFSGAGGVAIEMVDVSGVNRVHGNVFYNNETDMDADIEVNFQIQNDEVLTSTPLLKRGTNSYTNRYQYFRPRDVGNVRYGAYPRGG